MFRHARIAMKHWPYLLTLLVVIVIFGCRWFGPSDLYDNDQPKTVAYTVDMVRHGRWSLPVDMLGRPATKPPMYNWIGSPTVAAGWHSEFALKLPSTLAALVTIMLTWCAARWTAGRIAEPDRLAQTDGEARGKSFLDAFSAIACICLLANYSITKLCYTARPDMVLTAFLTAGWVLATLLLISKEHPPPTVRLFLMRLALWLCVAGAALTKGPPALLLVLYVMLGGKLLGGRWSMVRRSGIVWGLPLALSLFSIWLYRAYLSNPEHVTQVFLGEETVHRIGRGGGLVILGEFWKMPAFFFAKFFPWSVFAVMSMWHVFRSRQRFQWFGGAMAARVVMGDIGACPFQFVWGEACGLSGPLVSGGGGAGVVWACMHRAALGAACVATGSGWVGFRVGPRCV